MLLFGLLAFDVGVGLKSGQIVTGQHTTKLLVQKNVLTIQHKPKRRKLCIFNSFLRHNLVFCCTR